MKSLSAEDTRSVRRTVQRFLHADTAGCEFVGSFAKDGEGISWFALDGDPSPDAADALTALVESAQATNEVSGLVFPNISSEAQLRDLIGMFEQSARWTVKREPDVRAGRPIEIVRMCWLNQQGTPSSLLGMAPLLTMPVTRRAPYVSVFLWPSERANKHRKQQFPEIGIGDSQPPPLEDDAYEQMRKSTEIRSRRLNGGRLPPGMTFMLSV